MTTVTMRYWAAARQAAGVAEETLTASTLADALAAVVARRAADPAQAGPAGADALSSVLDRSSFLIDGEPVGTRPPGSVVLHESAVVEVLPPFAGG